MPRFTCFSVLLVTAAAGTAHAQAVYLPSQQSGIGVAASISHNDDALAISLGAGYSYKAFIDGGFFVHRYGFSTPEANVSAIGVRPYVAAHLLRQSDSMPVSVSANGNFQKYFYSATDSRDIDGYSFFLGGSAYRRFSVNETFAITPQVTTGYELNHTRGGAGLFKRPGDASSLLLQIAAHLAFQSAGSSLVWGVNPFMTVDSTYVTFGLSVGATFPVGRRS